MVTIDILEAAFRTLPRMTREMIVKASAPAIARFNIDTKHKLAAWLAQLHHESGGFSRKVENLNYSAERLREIFPRYFKTDEIARAYARKPVAIGNRAYHS